MQIVQSTPTPMPYYGEKTKRTVVGFAFGMDGLVSANAEAQPHSTMGGANMLKGTLTQAQAIAAVGPEAVAAVERENCDFTNRVMPAGWDDIVEFSASVSCTDSEGLPCRLVAYYYQDQADIDAAEELDHLDWEISGYEIV